jgi:hypothetical protein
MANTAGLRLQGFPPAPEGVDLLSHYRTFLDMVPPEFASVWIEDHPQFGRGDTLLEGWTLLAHLATGRTELPSPTGSGIH